MFGYVTANYQELSKEQQARYGAVYCGICRRIREQSGGAARLGLRYDMAFLSLLLMSLYEPEEEQGKNGCVLHPINHRPWIDNQFVRYAADMNVALAYYNCMDDWEDDGKRSAKTMAKVFAPHLPEIRERYPRQCQAIVKCMESLGQKEREKCQNPDAVAGDFGALMAELLVYEEDLWASDLRILGDSLGRFIYLLDAALDYDKDAKKGRYNPYLAMGTGKNPARWEEYLVLTMGRATKAFERLPLVQDKALLDNILYSGVWVSFRGKGRGQNGTGSV